MSYIDAHVHITPFEMLRKSSLELYLKGREQDPLIKRVTEDPALLVGILDDAGVEKALLISIVSPDIEGMPFEFNDFLSRYSSSYSDRLIPIGSIHPRFTKNARNDFEYIVDKLGMRGIKIHPPHQLVYPNEYRNGNKSLETIYSLAQERGLPVIVHTGTSIFPGARNVYSNPIYMDDIGVDYPDLKVIIAHGGRPLWTSTAFFLVRRHKNMYMDISGIPPKGLLDYFPRLEEISQKVLFGSDWAGPLVPGIKENIRSFLSLPLSSAAKNNILCNTARRVFAF